MYRKPALTFCFVLLALLLLVSAPAWCVTLFSETWESAAIGTLPAPWSLATTNSETTATVVQGYSGNTTKVLKFWDGNNDTLNNTVYTSVTQRHEGTVTFQFDCCFPNRTAGFGLRITNGGTPTSGSSWVACIKFEGTLPYAPGAAMGDISYQAYQSGTNAYVRTNPVATYTYNTWYTIKIVANMTTRKYDLYKGPKGGSVTAIATGIDFIKNSSEQQQATYAGGITCFSSTKSEDGSGSIYMDDITVTSDVANECATVSAAKYFAIGSQVGLYDKVVTAGTDQLKSPSFFYIQEGGVGLRIRSSTVARQGDRVTIIGTTQRVSDGGIAVLRTCEREINATSVVVTYGPNTLPSPVVITNRQVGGGPSTQIDTDGYAVQPGVWASSTGACSGYDQVNETGTNNIGQYSQVNGTVVLVDDVNRFFYINDGSNVHDGAWVNGAASPAGIRVLAPPGVPLTGLLNKTVTIQGVCGAVAQSEAGNPQGSCGAYIRSIRVFRPAPEMFLDYNLNGFWDSGEPYTDITGNSAYDGIRVTGVTGPTFTSRFDRYGTLILRGAAFMPKGLYCYTVDSGELTRAKNQGFNVVQCFDSMTPSDLATFNSVGVKAFPTLHNSADRPGWMAVKTDAAIAAWYLQDEPEWHGEDPVTALASYNWVKGQDPNHVVGNSHADLNAFASYAGSDDMCWSDRYPVGNAGGQYGVPTVADYINTARAAHGNNPYFAAWPYLQMFEEAPNFTVPTVAQFDAMIYLAMSSYSKGFFYFSDQQGVGAWAALWAEVANVNSNMNTLRPFLVLPWVPLDVTTSNPTWVRAGGYRVGNNVLLIAVNGDDTNSQAATISLPGIPNNTTLTAPIGGASQVLINRAFTYTFTPCEVRVLMYGSIPPNP